MTTAIQIQTAVAIVSFALLIFVPSSHERAVSLVCTYALAAAASNYFYNKVITSSETPKISTGNIVVVGF